MGTGSSRMSTGSKQPQCLPSLSITEYFFSRQAAKLMCLNPSGSSFDVEADCDSDDDFLPPPTDFKEPISSMHGIGNLRRFKRKELEAGTWKFRESNLVGEGAFGKVYMGWVRAANCTIDENGVVAKLPPRQRVAIKVLHKKDGDGYQEFLTEVLILGSLHHPNLVRLVGYCSEGGDAYLVYSYAPGGSLENAVFNKNKPLPWVNRLRIMLGIAEGLCYLHNEKLIHRDLKSSNVLLEEDGSPLLTDFGFARHDSTKDEAAISRCLSLKGTYGYLDPRYVLCGELSDKTDVYAYGVVLLEIVTGRSVQAQKMESGVLQFAKPYFKERKIDVAKMIDPLLDDEYNVSAARRIVHLARACLAEEPDNRPTMVEIVRVLKTIQLKFGTSRISANLNRRSMESLPVSISVESNTGLSDEGEAKQPTSPTSVLCPNPNLSRLQMDMSSDSSPSSSVGSRSDSVDLSSVLP